MNVLELSKQKVLDEESPEEDSGVTVTKRGHYICE